MNHQDIASKIIPFIKKAGVKRAGLFGSVVHGKLTSASDIDILVDFPQKSTLFNFINLKIELENALRRPVDLVEYESLKPQLKNSILNQEIRVYDQRQ